MSSGEMRDGMQPMPQQQTDSSRALRRCVSFALRSSIGALAVTGMPCAIAATFPPVIDLASLNGSDGFAVNGIAEGDYAGASVRAAGDVNGDHVGDFIIGAPNASPNAAEAAGEAYVVFGAPQIGKGGAFDLASLNGRNGFVVRGLATGDRLGYSVAGIGDLNGDGFDDVVISAPYADLPAAPN